MSERRTRLVDCNPRWVCWSGREGIDAIDAVHFDCPEGHDSCVFDIPFTPALDGSPQTLGVRWQRTGDTFETLTLSPSIRRTPTYASPEAAIVAGALDMYLTPSMFCAFHGILTNGVFELCGDSR